MIKSFSLRSKPITAFRILATPAVSSIVIFVAFTAITPNNPGAQIGSLIISLILFTVTLARILIWITFYGRVGIDIDPGVTSLQLVKHVHKFTTQDIEHLYITEPPLSLYWSFLATPCSINLHLKNGDFYMCTILLTKNQSREANVSIRGLFDLYSN